MADGANHTFAFDADTTDDLNLGPTSDDLISLATQLSDAQSFVIENEIRSDLKVEHQAQQTCYRDWKSFITPGTSIFRQAHINICIASSYHGDDPDQISYIEESLLSLHILQRYGINCRNNGGVKLLWDYLSLVMHKSNIQRFLSALGSNGLNLEGLLQELREGEEEENQEEQEIVQEIVQLSRMTLGERIYPNLIRSLRKMGSRDIDWEAVVATANLPSQLEFWESPPSIMHASL